MNMNDFFNRIKSDKKKHALPVLSFPAAQKLGVSVNQMINSAELQASAMELIAHSTDTIAAISLMDLSIEAEAFGANIIFADNEVPAITGQLVSDEDEAKNLEVPSVNAGRIPIAIETIKLAKDRISDKPVFAGIIGPYSLAGRLMDVSEIMYTCYDEPETVHEVLKKTTSFLIDYSKALKEAGADGIVMAEPLCGLLSPEMASEFSCPYVKEIIDAVQTDDFAVIYHNCGNSVPKLADMLYQMKATAYHFGNVIDLKAMLDTSPRNVIIMGNIDPVSCFAKGTEEHIYDETMNLLKKCAGYSNFILSSGCDIPHITPWENIEAFYKALKDYNNIN